MIESMPIWLVVILIGVFLLVAGFAQLLGAAILRISRSQVVTVGGSEKLLKIVDQRAGAQVAIRALYTLAVVALAGLLTLVVTSWLNNGWAVLGIVLGVSAILFPLLGLIIPVSLGARRPAQVLGTVAVPLAVATSIASRFVSAREPQDELEKEALDEDQLAAMVERVSESAAIEDDEREILTSMFKMSETRVREVMVPRTDMISIQANQPIDKAISLFVRSGFSRVPVVGESVDDLLGIVYLKDAIRRTHRRHADDVVVADVMREAQFVPETVLVDDLLSQMQTGMFHIAMVVDEYGGIAGLVTIEDLLEELVGEMVDEHDRALPEIEELGDGSYRVPARMPLDDVGELLGIELEDDDVDSIGGLLAKSLGMVPIFGSETTIDGIDIIADRFEGRRKRLSWVVVARSDEEMSDE